MQFVAKGPDIPETLLQAHEEGRVVFFCGAGISYPAGLPSFKELVDKIYSLVGTTRKPSEKIAYNTERYDTTLDLLERRLPGQRRELRGALVQALKPNLRRKGAKDTHTALLQLARSRNGALHLVTTNFDRIFSAITAKEKPRVAAFSAPLLPYPKDSRWNGIVYLHGLLPERLDESELNRLVLTSGDFGLAYLTERWAARFVSELFRNYIICFVGYSINDPVLRYMMDALAADRMLGEVTPQAYAFGDYGPGQEMVKTEEWEAKGVVPIPYEVRDGTQDHSALHRTLKSWAETYRDGILGRERIVVDYALTRPSASTPQDDFVGRMLWALSDETGLPAKQFAEFEPVPSLEWLKAFSDERYRHADLMRFKVSPDPAIDDKLQFSLVRRPAPYSRSPWMMLVSYGATESNWDNVMQHIASWLIRHLDDPELIFWLVQHGCHLHERLMWLIENRLDTLCRLEREQNEVELERIRAHSPKAVPRRQLRPIWRLFLTGHVKSGWHGREFHSWREHFKRDGLTTSLRIELRKYLAPKIVLKEPFRWPKGETETGTAEHLKRIVDWELALTADHVREFLPDPEEVEIWREAMPILLDDFQQLLFDTLDLLRELDGADDHSDGSDWDLPSISPHWQNRGFRDWVLLIELLRDSWLTIHHTDPTRASRIAQKWHSFPYPTFKRLALFAASNDGCIGPNQWSEWLTSDHAWWLWSEETKRETLRLLVLQGHHLSPQALFRLESAILAGPPRAMFRDAIESGLWQQLVDHSTWLRLAKLQSSGADLGHAAAGRLKELSLAHSSWHLAENQSDEFSHWMIGTGDPGFADNLQIDHAPRKRAQLVEWLKQPHPSRRPFCEDTWRETCRDRFFHCAFALCDLAQEEKWPVERWREALQVWSEEGKTIRSWRFIASLAQSLPDRILIDLSHSITWWLEKASKTLNVHEEIFLELCRRLMTLSHHDGSDTSRPVSTAINHPIGHITGGLLNLWFNRKPNDDDGLPKDMSPLFTQLCDTNVKQFCHGRVILASRIIAFYRVARPWTEEHLMPLFDWSMNTAEAAAVWEGFLWSARIYRPLMIALKEQFLTTAHHYSKLGEHPEQFAILLTYVALDRVDTYTDLELRTAFDALPVDALVESARALSQALDGAGEQREEYWNNRIRPFWHSIWPKSREKMSNGIAERLARLCIAARDQFPAALSIVCDWLQPLEHSYYVIHLLHESGLARRFPLDSLKLLNVIIADQPGAPSELGECLNAISQVAPELLQDPRHSRLTEYFRRRG